MKDDATAVHTFMRKISIQVVAANIRNQMAEYNLVFAFNYDPILYANIISKDFSTHGITHLDYTLGVNAADG